MWFIILGAQGLGFICFGLEYVEFEGEGGSSKEVHKHEGKQKTTVLIALRDAGLQVGSHGRQERVVLVTKKAGEVWFVSVSDVFTIGDNNMSGPHHVSGELEYCLCVS